MKTTIKSLSSLIASVLPLLLLCTAYATDGTWAVNNSGLWSTPGNWSGSVEADGSGTTADLKSIDITADRTVSLDSPRSIGNLIFGDTATSSAAGWTVDNNGNVINVLTLAGVTPTVTVNALGTGKAATISANIAGTDGLTKSGTGTLVLTGANTYSGATALVAGTLSVSSLANAGAGSNLGAFATPGATGLLFNGGSFTYTGGTTSTDRGFMLNNSTTGTLTNSGPSGTVLTMGAFATTVGNSYLSVGGSSGNSVVLGDGSFAPTTTAGGLNFTANIPVSTGGITYGSSSTNGFINNNGTASLTVEGISMGTFSGGVGGGSGKSVINVVTGVISGASSFTKAGSSTWELDGNNTYTGITYLNNGMLIIKSDAALGATAGSAIQNSGNSPTLKYIGTGDTSYHVIKLNGTTGVFTLDQSGTGLWKFAANFATPGAGSKTLTLQGSTTGTGEIAGNISDNSSTNKTAVTKSGTGTWTLSGANTYTGLTTVSAGTLLLNGDNSLSTGSVTVNGTSTLGGIGILGGSVTVATDASLAPGAPVGLLSIGGNLDISAPTGGLGKLLFDLATPATSDKIAAAGTLNIGNGALGLSDFVFTNLGGLQVGTYTLITTSAGVIGTLDSNNLTGMIASLTCSIRINGKNLELVVSPLDSDNDGLPDSYELAHTSPSSATALNPGDDLDSDGLTNLQEYQFGANPTLKDTDGDGFDDLFEIDSSSDPVLSTSTPATLTSIRKALEFRFNAANGVSYRIESSTDSNNWNTVETDIVGAGAVVARFYSIKNQPQRNYRVIRN